MCQAEVGSTAEALPEGVKGMTSTTVAVDLAKNACEIAVARADWRIIERQRLNRAKFARFFVQRPPLPHHVGGTCSNALVIGDFGATGQLAISVNGSGTPLRLRRTRLPTSHEPCIDRCSVS